MASGFERFKKVQHTEEAEETQQTGNYRPKNPYVSKTQPPAKTGVTGPDSSERGNALLLSKIHELTREIKALKQDIATFYRMTLDEDINDTPLTAEEARTLYFDFRAHPSHVINKITDKISKTGESNV